MTGSTEVTPTAKVPVGVTTITGYSSSLVLFLLAGYAFVAGDRSEQTLGTLAAGVAAVLTFLATQIGRYLQAHAQVKAAGQVQEAKALVPPPLVPYGTATPGVSKDNPDGLPDGYTAEDFDPDPEPPEGPNPSAAREVLDRTER